MVTACRRAVATSVVSVADGRRDTTTTDHDHGQDGQEEEDEQLHRTEYHVDLRGFND